MRILASALLWIGMIWATAPVVAQTYFPNYPVCLQTYDDGGGHIDCSYESMTQCAATASGRGGRCFANPYFVQEPEGRR